MAYRKIPQRYSVYRIKDEMPIVIYATARECAAVLGIRIDSFYRAVTRGKSGLFKTRDYAVYEDEMGDDDAEA